MPFPIPLPQMPTYYVYSKTTLGVESSFSSPLTGVDNVHLLNTPGVCMLLYVAANNNLMTGYFDNTNFYASKTKYYATRVRVCGNTVVTMFNGVLSVISGLGTVTTRKEDIPTDVNRCVIDYVCHRANNHVYITANYATVNAVGPIKTTVIDYYEGVFTFHDLEMCLDLDSIVFLKYEPGYLFLSNVEDKVVQMKIRGDGHFSGLECNPAPALPIQSIIPISCVSLIPELPHPTQVSIQDGRVYCSHDQGMANDWTAIEGIDSVKSIHLVDTDSGNQVVAVVETNDGMIVYGAFDFFNKIFIEQHRSSKQSSVLRVIPLGDQKFGVAKVGFSQHNDTVGTYQVFNNQWSVLKTIDFSFPIMDDLNRIPTTCYKTKLSFVNKDSSSMPYARISVFLPISYGPCSINGQMYEGDQGCIHVFANSKGEVLLESYVEEHVIALNPVQVTIEGNSAISSAKCTYFIDVTNFISEDLKTITEAKMVDACTEVGEHMDATKTQNIASFCRGMNKICEHNIDNSNAWSNDHQDKGYDHVLTADDVPTYDQFFCASSNDEPESFSFSMNSSGRLILDEHVLPKEVERIMHLCEESSNANSNSGNKFTDFINWLSGQPLWQGITWLVTTIGNRLKIVCEYVIDGIKKAIDFIIETWRDVREFFAEVWRELKLKWEGFINFLGYLCNWEDILLTKRFLKHGAITMFDSLESLILFLKEKKDIAFDYASAQVESTFSVLQKLVNDDESERMLEDSSGNEMLTQIDKSSSASTLQSKTDTAFENDQVSVVEDGSNNASFSSNGVNSLLDDLWQEMKQLGDRISALKEFDDAIEKFKSVSQPGAKVSVKLLSGLIDVVQGIFKVLIETGRSLTNVLLDLVRHVVSEIKYILFEMTINIPVVSDLYRSISREESLTIGDLFLLIISIPCTIVPKLVLGNKFKLKLESVKAIERSFKREQVLQLFGISASNQVFSDGEPTEPTKPTDPSDPSDKIAAQSIAVLSTVLSSIALVFCSLGDAQYVWFPNEYTMKDAAGKVVKDKTGKDITKTLSKNKFTELKIGGFCLLVDALATFTGWAGYWIERNARFEFFWPSLVGGVLTLVVDFVSWKCPGATPVMSCILGLSSFTLAIFHRNMKDVKGYVFPSYDSIFKMIGSIGTALRVIIFPGRAAFPDTKPYFIAAGAALNAFVLVVNAISTHIFVNSTQIEPCRMLICRC